jgi:hypothetical protein
MDIPVQHQTHRKPVRDMYVYCSTTTLRQNINVYLHLSLHAHSKSTRDKCVRVCVCPHYYVITELHI